MLMAVLVVSIAGEGIVMTTNVTASWRQLFSHLFWIRSAIVMAFAWRSPGQ